VSVKPDSKISEAVSLMMLHGYSQLPVMQSDRGLKGMVSWESIGSRLALNVPCNYVRECLVPANEVSADASLHSVLDDIIRHEYVLVKDASNRYTGIVTTTDLSGQFRRLTEPFLLIGEIERHLRQMLSKLPVADLQKAKDSRDEARQITRVDDLSFGEYVRFLQDPGNWSTLNLGFDQGVFIRKLEQVKEIRNDIMHFDPDLAEEDESFALLREFARLLRNLRQIGVV
jgi:CBS domain